MSVQNVISIDEGDNDKAASTADASKNPGGMYRSSTSSPPQMYMVIDGSDPAVSRGILCEKAQDDA